MESTIVSLIDQFSKTPSDTSFASLKKYVQSGEFRDEELSPESYTSVFDLLETTLRGKVQEQSQITRVREVRSLCMSIIQVDEFNGSVACTFLPPEIISRLVGRAHPALINTDDAEIECQFIENCLRLLYQKMVSCRCKMRSEIGKFLREFTLIPTRTCHLSPILNVLNVIISGMSYADRSLFYEILLPLHKPNGWSFWDRQTPVIGEYHKALVQCCHAVIEKENSFATDLIEYILNQGFPPINQSNTAKELLLLFEIGKFVTYSNFRQIKSKLMKKIIECIASENAQVVQSVLVFWKSPPSEFPAILRPYLGEYMESLLLVLYRVTGEPHWNPTVNKMTLLVLKSLEESDPWLFCAAADASIPVTEFAQLNDSHRSVPKSLQARVSHSSQPRLEITGVAPWQKEPTTQTPPEVVLSSRKLQGMEALEEFMKLLQPETKANETSAPSWQLALSAETPTMLPDLKFYDLVFGRDLGDGAFSTVRYARVVKRGGKTYLSQWDEVAVKIISYETIFRNHYGENILREICALRKLSHPSIARLISSFRWRDGIYLVLEYGSLGDLHTYVRRNGPLAETQARIVVGEIATALATVHESGFVYGDLKPENVVITSTRHIKLADFGACRPVTEDARNLVIESRNELSDMRSGDWKADSSVPEITLSDEDILFPKTFEGTTAYLSPEVVRNLAAGPTVLSDAWALGITTYFLMKGRLPSWVSNSDTGDSHFDSESLMASDPLMSDISDELKSFMTSLLNPNVDNRLAVEEMMTHCWFEPVSDVRRLFKMAMTSDHLPGDSEAGGPTTSYSQWEKRQLSKIWTAQPVDYALGIADGTSSILTNVIMETDVERDSPFM